MSLLPLDNLQVKLKGTWFREKDAAADFFKFHIGIFKNVYFLLCKQTEKRWLNLLIIKITYIKLTWVLTADVC